MTDERDLEKWSSVSDAIFDAFVHDYDGPHTDADKLIVGLEKRGWKFEPPPLYTRWVWSRWTAHPVEHVTHDSLTMQPVCGARLAVERLYFADEPTGQAPECQACKRREEARRRK